MNVFDLSLYLLLRSFLTFSGQPTWCFPGDIKGSVLSTPGSLTYYYYLGKTSNYPRSASGWSDLDWPLAFVINCMLIICTLVICIAMPCACYAATVLGLVTRSTDDLRVCGSTVQNSSRDDANPISLICCFLALAPAAFYSCLLLFVIVPWPRMG